MTTVRLALQAMATRFELVLPGDDEVRLRAAGEEALAEFHRLDAQLSFYRPSSEISRINARAATGPVRVEPRLFRLLQTARRLHTETGGAFDLTVAPLMRCWGFTGNTGRLPEPEALAEARLHHPRIPVWSNVIGRPHDPENLELLRDRLVEQIIRPVCWTQTCEGLVRQGYTQFHELAPGTVLRGLMRRIDRNVKVMNHDQPDQP